MYSDEELARRLAIIDAKDKILRQQITKETDINKARAYAGTCSDMCPERERYVRLSFNVSVFERNPQTNEPDERAMVKEYRRAGADQVEPLPHELRTPQALQNTMAHLVCNIMNDPRSKSNKLAIEWYDFLWDRLRAIRKDITQQNICDLNAAKLVEQCTRFHVHSCYAMNRFRDFDADMNKRNLNDCLQMLRQIYTDLRDKGIVCPGEIEFQRYDILLHFDEDVLYTNVLMKTSEHRSSKEMLDIVQLFNAYSTNQFYQFLKIMQRADYMTSCILGLYVNRMRWIGLRIIISACRSKQPQWCAADLLVDFLFFDNVEDLREFLQAFEIELQQRDNQYYLVLEKDLLNDLAQLGPTCIPPIKSSRLVENKMRGLNVGQLVFGSHSLPENSWPATRPLSFESAQHEQPHKQQQHELQYQQHQQQQVDHHLQQGQHPLHHLQHGQQPLQLLQHDQHHLQQYQLQLQQREQQQQQLQQQLQQLQQQRQLQLQQQQQRLQQQQQLLHQQQLERQQQVQQQQLQLQQRLQKQAQERHLHDQQQRLQQQQLQQQQKLQEQQLQQQQLQQQQLQQQQLQQQQLQQHLSQQHSQERHLFQQQPLQQQQQQQPQERNLHQQLQQPHPPHQRHQLQHQHQPQLPAKAIDEVSDYGGSIRSNSSQREPEVIAQVTEDVEPAVDNDLEQLDEAATQERLAQAANIMPAGKFKKSHPCLSKPRPTKPTIQDENDKYRADRKKSRSLYDCDYVSTYNETIRDEQKANDYMEKLVRMFD